MDSQNTSIKKIILHPYFLSSILPICFFLVFYFYPLTSIILKSFFSNKGFDFLNQFFLKRMTKIIWFTFWQAGISTILTFFCALPCAFVISCYDFKGRKLLRTLASIPFVLPAVVVAAALEACFGESGIFFGLNIKTPLILIFYAHVFYNFSIMLRILSSFWSSLQTSLSDAAYVLGANPLQVFFKITLPLLKPAIFASFLLVFIFCFSSFGIILILGGPKISTIETEIYRQAAHLFNLRAASFLSLIQIICTFSLMWIYNIFAKKSVSFIPQINSSNLKKPDKLKEKIMIASVIIFILLLCVLPLFSLLLKSLIYKKSLSLIFYKALFTNISGSIFHISPFSAIRYSLLFAFIALVIAVIIGMCAALFVKFCEKNIKHKLSSFLDSIFMLPLSTSAVTLGFGIIITLDKPPLNLRSSLILIPIVHALASFPFVFRAILPSLRSIHSKLHDAALMLGASPLRIFFTIDLPLIKNAIVASAIFGFTISLGEFGASIFTTRPDTPTIPIAIYRFLSQPGIMNYGQAMAIASILMIITAISFLIIEKLLDYS